jgi:large subunit ribosomal protein L23Ae
MIQFNAYMGIYYINFIHSNIHLYISIINHYHHYYLKGKAKKAAAALKKGSGRKATRVHTRVHFFKPKTLIKARKSPVLAKAALGAKAYDVIKYPLATESAMKKIEENNTLVFIVTTTSNKKQIKNAVTKLYDIKVDKVNTLIRPDGLKKAYVKLTSDHEALDVANRIGIC